MTQEELDALMKIGEELGDDDEGANADGEGNGAKQSGANAGSAGDSVAKSNSNADNKSASEAKSSENADNKSASVWQSGANADDKSVGAGQNDVNADNNGNDTTKNSPNADFKADNAAKSSVDALNLATNLATDSADEPEISTWSPPPPSKEHKVVHQLDEVTRDSEEKAIEMMDRLENIGKFFNQIEIALENIKANVAKNKETFTALNAKFPNIQTFQTALDASNKSLEESEGIFKLLQQGQDEVFTSMDAMQYQDIHRQKIERAINVMRALNRYMNSLFEGSIDDSKRVSSAVYIAGDGKNDVVDNDDIENLIASLRQNK